MTARAKGRAPRLCVACGARVHSVNPKVDWCDATCGRAKRAGVGRQEQLARDMLAEAHLRLSLTSAVE